MNETSASSSYLNLPLRSLEQATKEYEAKRFAVQSIQRQTQRIASNDLIKET